MAKKEHISETPATAFLRKHAVAFGEHPYAYEDKGGTSVSARELGVDEHAIRVRFEGMDIGSTLGSVRYQRDFVMSMPAAIVADRTPYFCPWVCFSTQEHNLEHSWEEQ